MPLSERMPGQLSRDPAHETRPMRRVRLELTENPFNRYIYAVVFALCQAGIEVRATPHPALAADLQGERYARSLVDIPGFSWAPRRRFERALRLGTEQDAEIVLDLDYFRAPASAAEVHLPIGQHPLMYIDNRWNTHIDMERPRSRVAVFAGNLDPAVYGAPEFAGLLSSMWGVTPRHEQAAAIDPTLATIRDARSAMVARSDWRTLLQDRAFFLALPGCQMPHAHNLTEAMSAGCIPIIQRNYAECLLPRLEHGVNAWIYEGLHDVNARLSEAAALDEGELRSIREGVVSYHREHLSLEATVRMLTRRGVHRAFVMAEGASVAALVGRLQV
jgi:hypothetical protein